MGYISPNSNTISLKSILPFPLKSNALMGSFAGIHCIRLNISAGLLSGIPNQYHVLLFPYPLPEHGTDIAAHHFSKTEQEPFLDTSGELIFRYRGKTKGLVK
jgi:hypothetical protein